MAAWRAGPCPSVPAKRPLHMVLLDKLSAFRVQYPGVHLRITNETTPQAIERLRNGESDFAVITAPQITDRTLPADRTAAVPGGASLRPRLQRNCHPAVHPGRSGPVSPGVYWPGHQHLCFLSELFHLQRGDLPGGCGSGHHGPDSPHDRARAGDRLLPRKAGGPQDCPGRAVLHSPGLVSPRARPSPWWKISAAPRSHRHEGHPGR